MPYQYIFDQWSNMIWIISALIGVFILIFSLWAFTGKPYYKDKKGIEQKKSTQWYIAIGFALIFSIIFSYCQYRNYGIKKRGIATTEKLISKVWHSGKSSGWRFKYSYSVNGELYADDDTYKQEDYEEDSARIGNCYLVLYDSTHPGSSFMDLHEPVKCSQ